MLDVYAFDWILKPQYPLPATHNTTHKKTLNAQHCNALTSIFALSGLSHSHHPHPNEWHSIAINRMEFRWWYFHVDLVNVTLSLLPIVWNGCGTLGTSYIATTTADVAILAQYTSLSDNKWANNRFVTQYKYQRLLHLPCIQKWMADTLIYCNAFSVRVSCSFTLIWFQIHSQF